MAGIQNGHDLDSDEEIRGKDTEMCVCVCVVIVIVCAYVHARVYVRWICVSVHACVCIPGVPEKAERLIFSTLRAESVPYFYVIR